MDFGSILHAAQQNSSIKNEVKYYPSKFEPPKKVTKEKKLSTNIQRFLAKKEQEEKLKELEKKQKRDEFLAMRDPKMQRKIQKMLKVTKSANKSVLEDAVDHNNTAVTLAGCDQPDEDDYGYVSQEASAFYSKMMEKYKTAPEEQKYPTATKRSNNDLLGTKDRVRQALERAKEEAMLPHKRNRKSKSASSSNEPVVAYKHEESFREPEKKLDSPKPKPRRPLPPPIDFNELLKIAETKQLEPLKPEPIKEIKRDKEPERLMTKQEKQEYEEHRKWQEHRAERERSKSQNGSKNNDEKIKTNGSKNNDGQSALDKNSTRDKSVSAPNPKPQSSGPSGRIPKLNGYQAKSYQNAEKNLNNSYKNVSDRSTNSQKVSEKNSDRNINSSRVSEKISANVTNSKIFDKSNAQKPSTPRDMSSSKLYKSLTSESKHESNSSRNDNRALAVRNRAPTYSPKPSHSSPNISKSIKQEPMSRDVPSKSMQQRTPTPNVSSRPSSSGDSRPKQSNNVSSNMKGMRPSLHGVKGAGSNDKGSRQFPPSDVRSKSINDVKGPRQFPPIDVKPSRQFPPQDIKGSKQFPPQDVRRKQFPPKDSQKKLMANKRRILDDDSEYDSELDDFIDDGPEGGEDYSKYIKDIFGYDKSRYRDDDVDDANMESNYATQMREEYISKKIGILEDLEDMKMEEMEKKQKSKIKKRR